MHVIMVKNKFPNGAKDSILCFGNRVTLSNFYTAIEAARTTAIEDSHYDFTESNCTTFALDVTTDLNVEYNEKNLHQEMTTFAMEGWMKDKKKFWPQLKRRLPSGTDDKVWRNLSSEKAVLKVFVNTYHIKYHSA